MTTFTHDTTANGCNVINSNFALLNDVLTEMGAIRSLVECAQILLSHFDNSRTDRDQPSYDHVNRMSAMLEILEKRIIDTIEQLEKTF